MAFIEFDEVSKFYKMGDNIIKANDKMTFSIEEGEFCIILGASGAGKSTTLNMLGGMDSSDEGNIVVDDVNVSKFNEEELTTFRRDDIGFVFQNYNLVSNLTALENVELASQIVEGAMDPKEALESVGLGHRLNNFPAQLSGGEQQRVAIARAIAKNPKLLLCDEPTGALDYQTGKMILEVLQNISKETGTTIVVITHNRLISPMADRVIEISDGRAISEKINEEKVPVSLIEW